MHTVRSDAANLGKQTGMPRKEHHCAELRSPLVGLMDC